MRTKLHFWYDRWYPYFGVGIAVALPFLLPGAGMLALPGPSFLELLQVLPVVIFAVCAVFAYRKPVYAYRINDEWLYWAMLASIVSFVSLQLQQLGQQYLLYGYGSQIIAGLLLFRALFSAEQGEAVASGWSKELLMTRIIENISEGILVTDSNLIIRHVNPAFISLTGYAEDELIGSTPKIFSSGKYGHSFYESMWRDIRQAGRWTGQIWNRKKNGELFLIDITITAVPDEYGHPVCYVGVFKDITERKKQEWQWRYDACYDALTGLPNRRFLYDLIERILHNSDGNNGGALLFVDVDRFKRINISFGRVVGDRLLQAVSERMSQFVYGRGTLARVCGDEFIIHLPGMGSHEQSSIIAQRLMLALSTPFYMDGKEIYITVSIGISHYPRDGNTPDELIKHANQAMYKAKERGRNQYYIYHHNKEVLPSSQPLEVALRRAVEREELRVHYQPQWHAKNRKLIGVEALVRWNHPEWGMIEPCRFIPLAEETGLIISLDRWVIRQACIQAKDWLDKGYDPISISVNMSKAAFLEPNFTDYLRQVLTETKLPSKYLEIELKENLPSSMPEAFGLVIDELKQLGIRITLDDFGSGFASFQHIKRFPIDRIKIARTFVKDIQLNDRHQAIVQTMIQFGENMRLDIVAEGVEAEEELECLLRYNCHNVQGFLFSAPVSADETEKYMDRKALV